MVFELYLKYVVLIVFDDNPGPQSVTGLVETVLSNEISQQQPSACILVVIVSKRSSIQLDSYMQDLLIRVVMRC
jgi:hypothetical protein